jgi:hypothetical protein
MSHDPAAVLRLFFAIPQSQIERDVAEGEGDFGRLLEQLRDVDLGSRVSQDPAVHALYHHRQMVRAKALRSLDGVSEEMKFQFIHMAADHVAEEAVRVAHEQGQIAALGERMRGIEEREGLKDGEYWPLGEGPEDYQTLVAESDTLYRNVRDTVLASVLRRYGLDDVADLFENHRTRFDATVERGRRMIFERGSSG